MKKILSLTLTTLLLLGLIGCTPQELPLETSPPVTEAKGAPQTTAPPETTTPATDPTEAGTTQSTEPSEVTDPTESTESTGGTEPTQPQKPKENTRKQEDEAKPTPPPATELTQPATEPKDPPATQPSETTPPETQSPETEPPSTQPTESAPTEPTECLHDWMCIHHDEEGHWIAGIMCDCGWTAYGDPNELVTKWNAHSASYPAAESMLEHSGFGCMDEWSVETPAYDEWVCRHCGESKP